MSTIKNNLDTLISKITEETCNEVFAEKNKTETPIDLSRYFEERLNEVDFNSMKDYLEQKNLTHFQLNYHEKIGCYRLQHNEVILDFPANWSIFQQLASVDFIYLDQNSDRDCLLDIFSEVFEDVHHVAFVRDMQNSLLVLLREDNSCEHIEWMKKYLMKMRMPDIFNDSDDEAMVA